MDLKVNNVTEKNSACREGSRRHAPCKKNRKGRAAGTLVDVRYFCYRLVVSLMLAFWACDALSVVWLMFAQCAVRSEEAGVTPLA
jgi:hypothetical protein